MTHPRRQQLEFLVLDILSRSSVLTGASSIRQQLMHSGITVGEATIGRVLRDLDVPGYTQKTGKLGRKLTQRGIQQLEALRVSLERESAGRKITSFFTFKDPDGLIEVLESRRAIERETARLAALRATPAQIETMRKAIAAHSSIVSDGLIDAEHDDSLHNTIAAASGNRLLASLFEMIRKDREVSAVVRRARAREHVQCAREHKAILEAIERRDAEAAEGAMQAHLDGLVAAVRSLAKQARSERRPRRQRARSAEHVHTGD
jgi:GntR family L-lactate dehydrogenase operon transcriptional regulator